MSLTHSDIGASIILNSGSLTRASLTDTDKFGKYSAGYVVGMHNGTLIELQKMCKRLAEKNGADIEHANFKKPWRLDSKSKMSTIFAGNKKKPPVMGMDKRVVSSKLARDGDFCKLNVTPMYYALEDQSSFVAPDGLRHVVTEIKQGISLFLNGLLLLDPETEELF